MLAGLLAAAALAPTYLPSPAQAASARVTSRTSGSSGADASPAGWITTRDAVRRVSTLSQAELVPSTGNAVHLAVDPATRYQQMDGFGAALTESSAHLLMGLSSERRTAALTALFAPEAGAGMDLVRMPLGGSDFALSRYTYDDLPAGESDLALKRFSLGHDNGEIVPVLRQAVTLNPALRVMVTPWSAPGWMKTNDALVGGTLRADRTVVYAKYLVRSVRALRARGVPVRYLTLQNEPGYSPGDYPGMTLTAGQEAALVTALAPRMVAAGLGDVALIGYDHNWDGSMRALDLLADPAARSALAGTAWHCYGGTPAAQTAVHDAYPDKGIWFTECSGGSWAPDFAGNLGWNAATLAIGATRNWARSVLLWNLALDPSGGPHTGGCNGCRGVLTIDPVSGAITRNVEWDVLALAGKAVQPGAVRIGSPADQDGVKTVAYTNPDGSRVLTAYNSWGTDRTVVVSDGQRSVGAPLPAGSVATLTW